MSLEPLISVIGEEEKNQPHKEREKEILDGELFTYWNRSVFFYIKETWTAVTDISGCACVDF
jgi:hypothetical protein